ncbi:MAG TPA: hypothetical protein VIG24_12445 [Acidimicrobiia bacterium]
MIDDTRQWAKQFRTFLDNTQEARADSELARDYYDSKQWTSEQAQILKQRGQAPIVINRVAPKIDFLLGVEKTNRTDPKAFPRTPDHDKDAEAATDALRYVADKENLDDLFSTAWEELCIEGVGAITVEVEERRGKMEILIEAVHWDRFYYDPHSREKDYRDSRYFGVSAWLDKAVASKMFPEAKADIEALLDHGYEDETFGDRPSTWVDSSRQRVRVNRHFYLDDEDRWNVVYFSGNVELRKPKVSPFVDEDGDPVCPIIAQSMFVDRENNRYGLVKRLISPQDEINHRRSKALHMLSSIRAWQTRDGVIPDRYDFLNQLSQGKGVATANGVKGVDWDILSNGEYAQGQLLMLQEAKNEIDSIGANASLAGKEDRNLSGRALLARQQGGLTELGPAFDNLRHLKLRVYRAIWQRIRQFWDDERWIRVTDDEHGAKFVGLNQPMTRGDVLLEQAKQMQAQGMPVQPFDINDPSLQQVVGVEREVASMDVDIIISDAPDTINLQAEQFDLLVQMFSANPQAIPFEMVIQASQLRDKDKILERLQDPAQSEALQKAQALEMAEKEADIQETQTQAQWNQARAAKTQAETMETNVDAAVTLAEAEGRGL